MSFMDEMKKFQAEFEPFLDKFLKCVEVGSQIAEVVPQAAPIAGIVNVVATAADAAVMEHEAAGSTTQSAIVAATKIATAVGASGAVNAETAAKIATISASVAQLSPEIAAAVGGS